MNYCSVINIILFFRESDAVGTHTRRCMQDILTSISHMSLKTYDFVIFPLRVSFSFSFLGADYMYRISIDGILFNLF